MSDFRSVPGFDEVWRPPVRPRQVRPEGRPASGQGEARARLTRLVRRAPEVMVKVTGRVRGQAHLIAHLLYITRKGELDAEGPDGWPLSGVGT